MEGEKLIPDICIVMGKAYAHEALAVICVDRDAMICSLLTSYTVGRNGSVIYWYEEQASLRSLLS